MKTIGLYSAPNENPEFDIAIDTDQALAALAAQMPAPPALAVLCHLFNLSPFERDLLLLCAGVELDARFPALCAAAQGGAQRTYVTFGLALAMLADTHWSALAPNTPLRRWQLIQVEPSRSLVQSPLQIDERILHFLAGVEHVDARLDGLVRLLPVPADLVPSHQALAETLAATWRQGANAGAFPAVQLCGPEVEDKRAIAAAACRQLGLSLYLMPVAALPANQLGEFDRLLRLWERDALLSRSALLLDCDDDSHTPDSTAAPIIAHLLENNVGLLIISSRERQSHWQQMLITFDVAQPSGQEQKQLWTSALGDSAQSLNGQIDQLVAQFDLNAPHIWSACTAAQGQLHVASDNGSNPSSSIVSNISEVVWDRCRIQARLQLDDLAQRIDPIATWDELVLPAAQKEILREAAMDVRQCSRVYDTWGFVAKGKRGLGISALFAGASGTGKTMAAEVLAHELRLDLYRIDRARSQKYANGELSVI